MVKRIWIYLLESVLVILIASVGFSQSSQAAETLSTPTLTSPTAGDELVVPHITFAGQADPKTTIVVFINGRKKLTINNRAQDDGEFKFYVPVKGEEGEKFRIKLYSRKGTARSAAIKVTVVAAKDLKTDQYTGSVLDSCNQYIGVKDVKIRAYVTTEDWWIILYLADKTKTRGDGDYTISLPDDAFILITAEKKGYTPDSKTLNTSLLTSPTINQLYLCQVQ